MSVIEPSSITGRKESCCARLKRWISSTNSSVPCPCARRTRAASKIFFSSATPVWIAESCTNASSRDAPIRRATVVLPLPGGPQKIIEPSEGALSRRVSAPSGPVRCSWPETSASDVGRSRSASGAGGGSGLGLSELSRLMGRRKGSWAACPAPAACCPAVTPACRARGGAPLSAILQTREPSDEFLRPSLRPIRNTGLYPGTARAAHRNHGPQGRGEKSARRLHADRPPRQDRLSGIGRRIAPGWTGDDRPTRSSASIR